MFMVDKHGEIVYPFMRTGNNYDTDLVSRETGIECPEPTLAQQQFKEECDINEIVRRFGLTGNVPTTAVQPMVGDFEGITDYHSALNVVIAANENFYRLPASVREKFNHEPQKFVDFCIDPANIEAVREMGLAPRPEAPKLTEIVENGKQ